MWFLVLVASVQILPFMAMRMSSNHTKLLQEVSAEQQDSPEQAVENAQKQFAKLNARFEEKLQRIQEANAEGQKVSRKESEEVEKAHQAADQAHATLDKAVAALKSAGAGVSNELPLALTESTAEEELLLSEPEAQQKLLDAKEHFAVVDKSFKKKLEKEALAKKLNIDLPAVDREALDAAHQDAIHAQKSVDEASALVLKLKAQTRPAGVEEKAQKRQGALLQRAEEAKTRGSLGMDALHSRKDDDELISDAQQKLILAWEHFVEANASFVEQMYNAEFAKKSNVARSAEDQHALVSAQREATAAQRALDKAVALARRLETQNA